MLANGERVGGVSIFFVDDRIDGGELCGQRSFAIRAGESLDAFIRRSKAEAAELLLEVLDALETGRVERRPLDLTTGSYYSWPDRAAVRRLRAAGHPVW
jgi:methionyl-tRNA formyltransferase